MYGAYLPKKPKRVLVLGSGALQIGQAGEFDYSGSQAIKALKEERIKTILVNPNIATIQTSPELADRIYLVAVTPEFVERIIVQEEVDAIMLSFGGQTALNCGLALHDSGVLEKYGIQVLGSPVESIRNTEDRHLFIEQLSKIGVHTARSRACKTPDEIRVAAEEIGFPVMLRGAFALGGKGSGIVENQQELDDAIRRAFSAGQVQVLVEECLRGWKEIEYEVVRDARDNCITVCNMENLDPMGIHTGESIVIAPSQTLNDREYHFLREVAIRAVRHFGIIGECNIQYALNPDRLEYRVIEINARLSRSSALASKATGYPLAYVAAKIAIGYTLPEIPNSITRRTTAFFEPALDYIVCKVPRWDLTKFQGAAMGIGSEMKSVGEVMAIGRTFPEVIQKALRMLDIGVDGLNPTSFEFDAIRSSLKNATTHRIFAIARAFLEGLEVDEVHELTQIDEWFLRQIEEIVQLYVELGRNQHPLPDRLLRKAKEFGFSDRAIERLLDLPRDSFRHVRKERGITSETSQIDTLAAEFPADTNYLYTSYHARHSDVKPSWRKKVLVLGSGPYRIGSSVEFDWCCVSAVQAAADAGYETIMLNYNPETVSTDYDICDKLYFEEISFESVMDLWDRERPDGVIVSMGGQIPNNLAIRLHRAGVRILGTSPEDIDRAEDRNKFSALLDDLGIDQPRWTSLTDTAEAEDIVDRLGGFPVLVRPSYVLSGAAMSVAHEPKELGRILSRAVTINPDYPVVVSKFEVHAREIEIDAVADDGEIVLWAVSEHIEDAGVHSGDATLVLPPQTVYIRTIREIRRIAASIARELKIMGPFNMQFLAKLGAVKVIECNLRASRSFPFVSKVTGTNFAAEATNRMLGLRRELSNETLALDYVGVKVPMFSFSRIVGADPMLGVEMTSTGEVGCLGDDLHEALLHGLLATGFRFPTAGVLVSLGPIADKYSFAEEAKLIVDEIGLPVYATRGTAERLIEVGVDCIPVEKEPGTETSAFDVIDDGRVDLVINIPREYDEHGRPDGYQIRRRAVDAGIPLITDLKLAGVVVEALRSKRPHELGIVAWGDYTERRIDPLS